MRIITGKARGLKLKAPRGDLTRPTSDRIKESIFSILTGIIDFNELNVLDLFAGTGALGLEAVSRGANHATFVDMATYDIIFDNVNRAHFTKNVEIIRGNVFKILDKFYHIHREFDLIFVDPPYNQGLWQRTVNIIDEYNLLKPGGLLVVEHGISEEYESSLINIELIRQVKYGHTTEVEIYKNR